MMEKRKKEVNTMNEVHTLEEAQALWSRICHDTFSCPHCGEPKAYWKIKEYPPYGEARVVCSGACNSSYEKLKPLLGQGA